MLLPALTLAFLVTSAAAGEPPASPETPEAGWNQALRRGDVETLTNLLAAMDDPDAGADSGRTALMLAAQKGDAGLSGKLIEAGADVNARNPNDGTPLMYAAAGGNPEVVRRLLAAGADVEARAKLGWTPLLVAAAKGRTEAARELVAGGADPNARDVYGWTPLMRALSGEYRETAEVFLGLPDVDLDVQEESGNTALHLAAAAGDTEAVRELLERGASPGVMNHLGMTPLDVALSRGREGVAGLLSEAGSPPAESR